MTNIKFLKTLTAGFALATAIYPQAFAACPSGYSRDSSSGLCTKSACSGKCTYYYNDTTFDFEAKVNPGVAAGTPVIMNQALNSDVNVHNATINEGITGSSAFLFGYGTGSSTGTLTLPSTYIDNPDVTEFFNVGFGTIDASAVKNTDINISADGGSDVVKTVIVSQNSNALVVFNRAYSTTDAYSINIVCKGDKRNCSSMAIVGSDYYSKNIKIGEISYYVGDDGNGNWEVWSDDGLALYADSTLQKPLGKYDFDGNQTGVYKYDGAGNLTASYENGVSTYKRTSYTPAEAAAAVKKGNNNKVTLTFK